MKQNFEKKRIGEVAIVNLGTELTQGFTINTNAHKMAGRLRDLGFSVAYEITLPDDATAWNSTWKMILDAKVSTVILGGGLGPTEDDKTRSLVSDTFEVPLEYRAEQEEIIRDFFKRHDWEYTASNRIQACFPQGADVLDNPVGTAPGFRISQGGVTLFAVPGVPHEAMTMFERHIVPYLTQQDAPRFFSSELRLSGISESEMGERFSKVRFPEGVGWSSLPVDDSIIFRLYTHGDPEILDRVRKELIGALEDKLCVISTDGKNLVETVASLLEERGETLSTAESCTGGMIASEIVGIPGASDFFKGGACTYWNDAKRDIVRVPQETLDRYTAVSEETAKAMAEGARRVYMTDWAVSTTGIAGPDGGTPEKPVGFVWMAVASKCKTFAFSEKFSGNRGRIREKSVNKVLDSLRRAILEQNEIEQKSTCTKVQ